VFFFPSYCYARDVSWRTAQCMSASGTYLRSGAKPPLQYVDKLILLFMCALNALLPYPACFKPVFKPVIIMEGQITTVQICQWLITTRARFGLDLQKRSLLRSKPLSLRMYGCTYREEQLFSDNSLLRTRPSDPSIVDEIFHMVNSIED
jgi:hypothetical protein